MTAQNLQSSLLVGMDRLAFSIRDVCVQTLWIQLGPPHRYDNGQHSIPLLALAI